MQRRTSKKLNGAILVCLVSGSLLASAYAHSSASFLTRDSAIEIAKKVCKWQPGAFRPYARWRARLRGDEWHVWLTIDAGDSEEPRCCDYKGSASLDVMIRADNGQTKGCGVMMD
jgi:hypothetical protein